ncbi:putative two-component system response regulator [Alloactinosynnema sp. L-07]|uniref:response regulator n=1 Tax=Alloactinosynnema sp. L-07 TaxID=1653480 RepID=UPI00065F00D5|nr:response regulator [Alloactinosynnema sp. L-07]CRK56274.1 putative two-component system response regulator [Alloactinosynnema sp. L-07]
MISVLVVEDNAVAAQAHRVYVERVSGFAVAGVVHSGRAALRFLDTGPVDLVLLDLYLPDGHGLDVVRALRAAGHGADVIAVTSARDLAVVRAAVSAGVVQYLLKPFTFAGLRDKLEGYARFRDHVRHGEAAAQSDVDEAFGALRGSDSAVLPKGMSGPTLDLVISAVRTAEDGLSAAAAADEVGVSRVTARRYLEFLADQGQVVRRPRYGTVGRPEVVYQWAQKTGPVNFSPGP